MPPTHSKVPSSDCPENEADNQEYLERNKVVVENMVVEDKFRTLNRRITSSRRHQAIMRYPNRRALRPITPNL